ncbi:MAG: DEAD/DEAH box helicase [Rubrivivax sp.]|nr:DEAD/DEAH box helicase [Rubrivivax sp.]
MSDDSNSFSLLDERIQRFIWAEGWEALRDAQEAAIPLIVKADRDVIVAAATAAGKTEAAFFPALTHLVQNQEAGLIVYISPLKALINDQFGRLERLCERLDVPVWPWHGDVSSSVKNRFHKKPSGVLLITPESLEATLCNRGSSVAAIFKGTTFFVVDELHAFIGSERGKQLQSLMHRIQTAVNRRIPRIGLSATLGDMGLAAEFLRPGAGGGVAMVQSHSSGLVQVQLRGYEELLVVREPKDDEEVDPITPAQITSHLFKVLRGSNNLVFPNSRSLVEKYTNLLTERCAAENVPNEFWPHHGSLSKEIRTETEAALKQKERPATAICTNTLELGIDIGAVKSVVQVGPPPSVAGLRQRLGRSGRRPGEPAILRGVCVEKALGGLPSLGTELRLSTVQFIACISLLAERWFEPPRANGAHLSTLVQQTLSAVSQYGGATIGQLYSLLCAPGAPFSSVSKPEFTELIRHLGQKDVLVQDSTGILLHGQLGEKFVNHYTFYPAFATEEEYRVVTGGKTLGTIPLSTMLAAGQRIVFAGKTWLVQDVDDQQKSIYVTRSPGGKPPPFDGGGGRTHTKVRQRMRALLEGNEVPAYLDAVASRFLEEGRKNFAAIGLASLDVLDQGGEASLMTWLGDSSNAALACLLRLRGFTASPFGPTVEIRKGTRSTKDLIAALAEVATAEPPAVSVLLADAKNLQQEKWDWALPKPLLQKTYASLYLEVDEAVAWCQRFTPTSAPQHPSPTAG